MRLLFQFVRTEAMLTYGHTWNHWKGYEGLGWLLTNFGSDNGHMIIDMTLTEEIEITL